MRKLLGVALIVLASFGVASADSFTFTVLNSAFNGGGNPLPAGVVNVTQNGANSVSFSITMFGYAANAPNNGTGQAVQYMIGVGGFEFNLANTSNLSISNVSATNGVGNPLGNIHLNVGGGNYDGFGGLDVNVSTSNNGNNVNNSATSFNFTLTRSVGTLAISDFQALTSSNCPNPNPCTFVAHVNEYSIGAGGNINTGFGGTNTHTMATPEPAGLALFGSGLLGFGGLVRKKFRK